MFNVNICEQLAADFPIQKGTSYEKYLTLVLLYHVYFTVIVASPKSPKFMRILMLR